MANASDRDPRMHRRAFVLGAGAFGMALGTAGGTAYTQIASSADHSLRIAPLRLELARGKVIDTFAYNGTVPGPVLRLREGRQVGIDIRNDTDVDDIVHWHGLYLPSQSDGAMEEGSPMVPRGGTQRYEFVAKPAGTRWYHSHNMAGTDLRRSLYAGLYGFLIVEPPSDPGRYDQEVLLAAHHWEGIMGQHAGYPPRSAARQRPRGDVRLGLVQRQDARPRRADPGSRRPARAVPAAQCQRDRECQAGAARPSHDGDRARRQSRAVAARRRRAVSGAGGTRRRDRGDEPARCLDLRRGQRRLAPERARHRRSSMPTSAGSRSGRRRPIRLGLHAVRPQRPAGAGAGPTYRAAVREGAGRPRRLQPLDHQRQVLAQHQSVVQRRSAESATASS